MTFTEMRRSTKTRSKTGLGYYFALSILLGTQCHAAERNLTALAEIVVPAYTAMDFAMMCARVDPQLPLRTRGPRGSVLHYAQHIKDEVIASLNQNEASIVLKAAADRALAVARQELASLAANEQTIVHSKVLKWCEDRALPFVLDFVEQHDKHHIAVLQQIEGALR